MKKTICLILNIIILLSFVISNAKTADKIYSFDDVTQKGEIVYDKKLNIPINGIIKSFYRNGVLLSEIPFTNGKINGVAKRYYSTGRLDKKTTYKDGKIVPIEQPKFTPDNRIDDKIYLLDEDPRKIKEIMHYSAHETKGIVYDTALKQPLNGIVGFYMGPSILVETTLYKNGKKNGLTKQYHPSSGFLMREKTYKDGKMNGLDKSYYESGALKSKSYYKNGVLSGKEEHFKDTEPPTTGKWRRGRKIEGR